jgi:hypothetical protein
MTNVNFPTTLILHHGDEVRAATRMARRLPTRSPTDITHSTRPS